MNHLQAEALEREVRAACVRHDDTCVWVMAIGQAPDDDEVITPVLGLDGRMPLPLVVEIGRIVERHMRAVKPWVRIEAS